MKKLLAGVLIGIIIGWLNPIEGPLDWTYDKYSSQPSHKSPERVAPIIKENPLFIWLFEEEEENEVNTLPLPNVEEEE